ncbi:hypothetical protein SDC9_159551 [bioreactor metagenome]|uniref:Uncharacterized protein n=1 Tax=bioreactor metagenome TaxID=1076179 RepID=A0A645FFW2_9ZZZZ
MGQGAALAAGSSMVAGKSHGFGAMLQPLHHRPAVAAPAPDQLRSFGQQLRNNVAGRVVGVLNQNFRKAGAKGPFTGRRHFLRHLLLKIGAPIDVFLLVCFFPSGDTAGAFNITGDK